MKSRMRDCWRGSSDDAPRIEALQSGADDVHLIPGLSEEYLELLDPGRQKLEF
jgi:hypothetical protein